MLLQRHKLERFILKIIKMGLLIKSTEEKKIVIQGTEIELPNIYARLEFVGRACGKKLEIAFYTFASKNAFKQNCSPLSTSVAQGCLTVELLETEVQDLPTADLYAKKGFEKLGFEVEII